MKLRSAETQAVAALIAVGLADRATLGADPAVAEELHETLLERGEFLTQGVLVVAGHAMRPGRLYSAASTAISPESTARRSACGIQAWRRAQLLVGRLIVRR